MTNAVGVAVSGTAIAALFTGRLTQPHWTSTQLSQFQDAVTIAILALAVVAAALVIWASVRSRAIAADKS